MAFNLHPHFRVAAHPFRLALQHRALIGADIAAIKIEEDAVANIRNQIFLATGADIAGPHARTGAAAAAGISIGAGGEQRDAGNTEEFQLHDWFPFREIIALCSAVKARSAAVKPKPAKTFTTARATMSGPSRPLALAEAVR